VRGVDPTFLALLGQSYASGGCEAFLRTQVAAMLESKEYVSPLLIAMKYAARGDVEGTLEWLQTSYEERCPWLLELRCDPAWNLIRADRRFQELVERIGLPD